MPGGHESTYTPEVGARLCELLCSRKDEEDADGRKPFHSVRSICAEVGIAESTIYKWLHAHPTFAEQYTRARETRAHLVAEETIEVVEAEPDATRARVKMDVRKWYAGKLAPKTWGDKTVLAGDPDAPQKHEIEHKGRVHLDTLTSRISGLSSRSEEDGGSGEPK